MQASNIFKISKDHMFPDISLNHRRLKLGPKIIKNR